MLVKVESFALALGEKPRTKRIPRKRAQTGQKAG
jgi:hypothetical protein